jgi:hypothetical protein
MQPLPSHAVLSSKERENAGKTCSLVTEATD